MTLETPTPTLHHTQPMHTTKEVFTSMGIIYRRKLSTQAISLARAVAMSDYEGYAPFLDPAYDYPRLTDEASRLHLDALEVLFPDPEAEALSIRIDRAEAWAMEAGLM